MSGEEAGEAQKQPYPPEMGSEWFTLTCINTEAHGLLLEIEKILKDGVVSDSSTAIIAKVHELTGQGKWPPNCPHFCACAIQVVKRLAFLPDAAQLCNIVFPIIVDAWRAGLEREDELSKKHGYDRIIVPDKLLEGWVEDLPRVARLCLPSYLRLLRFERLLTRDQFDYAIDKFVKCVEELTPEYAEVAAMAANTFTQEILNPLLSVATDKAILHVAGAATLIATAVRLNPQGLLNPMGFSRRAWVGLSEFLCKASVSPIVSGRPAVVHRHLYAAYLVLNRLHRTASEEVRHYLRGPLTKLMPWLGGWEERPLRKKGGGWKVSIQYSYGKQPHDVDGDAIDFCAKYKGVHVRLGSSVKNCSCLPGEPVRLELHNAGEPHFVDKATVVLTSPDGDKQWPCDAKAIRGWMYEDEFNKPGKVAGAVFSIADMPPDLQMQLSQLADRSGLGPLAGSHHVAPIAERPFQGAVSVSRFGDGPQGLLKGMCDLLYKMADKIHLDGLWRTFWTARNTPASEQALDALFKQLVQDDVNNKGAVLVSQAESGGGICDYLIERSPDKLWVELKPSYAKRCNHGLRTQLFKYMLGDLHAGKPVAGLFLVFGFNAKFRPDSKEHFELLAIRDNVCRKNKCWIDVAIIDCDKPAFPSTDKSVIASENGLQYYEYELLSRGGSQPGKPTPKSGVTDETPPAENQTGK